MDVLLTKYDIKRLEMYCNNLVDYHLVVDLLPTLARLYFLNKMGDIHLSAVQAVSIELTSTFLTFSIIYFDNVIGEWFLRTLSAIIEFNTIICQFKFNKILQN